MVGRLRESHTLPMLPQGRDDLLFGSAEDNGDQVPCLKLGTHCEGIRMKIFQRAFARSMRVVLKRANVVLAWTSE